ncbi:MAG: hypothetical protein IH888_11770 [Planctomycetes bacterium]|nr:hypothetical protein [Planctomycetota bacterium]
MSSRQSLPVTATVAAVLVAVPLTGFVAPGPTVIFVDDDNCPGPGGGTKGDPFCSIQDAIDAAVDGDEVVVSAGTYFESIDVLGKAITVRSSLGPGVTTIDGTGLNDSVVKCISGEGPGTVLEGFTVTGGTGTVFPFVGVIGGGMFNHNSSPTIINIIFIGNTAQDGGGMANFNCSPTVTDCTFSGNTASSGGGMRDNNNSSPTVTNCTFSGNTAGFAGGGMYNTNSSPTVTHCTFRGNLAIGGGGMSNSSGNSPTITSCTFSENTADFGGGMYNLTGASPTVTHCEFNGNTAGVWGGGMVNSDSSPTVTDCSFRENSSLFGGGMRNGGGTPTVINCVFSGNSANSQGGGMYNQSGSSPVITHCTFSVNSAVVGGGMYNVDSSPKVINCILWGDSPDEIFDLSRTSIVTYSDVAGGFTGEGNIDADPLFTPGPLGSYYLSQIAAGQVEDSPCVDTGDPNSPLIKGTTRSDEVADADLVDMGYHWSIGG